ncbi:hypothetical protein ANN_09154 [Periplaneta americana]|uniref:Uncharacterized protein n=1 Tax=Periplaneta americana TaxID=6978 RepID=A0ABQ8TMT0_PERAM|nr:hypothetical protein ANN_09154 [Periplaneta americana]
MAGLREGGNEPPGSLKANGNNKMNDFDDISEQFQHLKQMSYEQHHCQSLNAPNHSKIGDKDLVQESSDENHIECLLLHSSLHSLNMSTQISEGQNEASRTTKEIYLKALDETNSNLKVRNDFQLKNPFLINSDNETKEDNLPKRNMKVKKNVSRALKGLHLKFPDDSNKDKQLLLNSGLRNPSIVDDHTEMKENNLPEYNIKVVNLIKLSVCRCSAMVSTSKDVLSNKKIHMKLHDDSSDSYSEDSDNDIIELDKTLYEPGFLDSSDDSGEDDADGSIVGVSAGDGAVDNEDGTVSDNNFENYSDDDDYDDDDDEDDQSIFLTLDTELLAIDAALQCVTQISEKSICILTDSKGAIFNIIKYVPNLYARRTIPIQKQLIKKDISKALKGMNLKVSNHDASMLQVTNDLQLKASYDVKQQDGLREHDIIVRKEVTKALKELMETGKKQELAAIKIQAAFRGYQTRKLLNVKVKSPDEYIFLKSIKKNSKEEPCPNRPVHIRSHVQSLNNDTRFKKTTNSTAFHSTSVSGNDFMERLKSVYVESYPYNMMTAIQNTMLSRSSPGQLYWVQANCTPKLTKEQTVPVIDASKGKMKKRLSIHQFAHSSKTNRKEYESSIISDNDSIQEESSLLDDNYFSSDESGMRRKKRFNIKSSGDLLPSRVKPACWSKSDSEIIVRHSASSKSRMKPHNSSWKEYIEKNIRLSASSISQGKPAIMPKRGKYSDCGLVAPNVELRRKTERLSEMCSDAENSGNDAWNRRIVHHQPTSYSPIFSTAPETAFKSYRKGHSSRDATKPVYSAGVLQSGVTAVLDDRNKEKIQNNYNCKIRERILAQMSALTPSTTSFASAVESEHVSENGDSQTMKKFDVLVEDKQLCGQVDIADGNYCDLNVRKSDLQNSSVHTEGNNDRQVNTSFCKDVLNSSAHKIDKLIQEEKESAQRHIDLLNEKFKLLKERTKADMKLIQMEIRTHIGEGDEYLVPALKKQSSLVKNLEQVKAENKRTSATHVDLPSVLPSIEDVEESSSTHESESYNLSEFMPVRDQEKFSEEALILPDTSLKQDQNSVDKFNSYEEITDTPLTESGTDIIALERRVEGLHEQLRKKKHEAEKLSRAYQLKKKQQLRNKEQILLKQLQEYDAYISKTRKELEDSRDNLTDTSSLSENVLYDNKIELSPSCDTIKQLSERKVLEQKENREEEGKSDTGQSVNLQSSGTIESSQQISSKDVTSKKSILQGQSKELRELSSTGYVSLELEIQNGFSENSNVETVPHCFVIRPSSVNSRQQNIPVKKDLEEEFEVIEQMEDIPENLEGQSNMQKSITCTQNFETIINEFLNKSDYVIEDVFDEKLESKSIIERSTGVKHDSEFDVRGLSEENHDSESSIQELTEAKHDAGFDVQECIEKKCDLGSDIQGLIEEKCDSEYHIQELIEENDTTYSVIQELTERKGDDSESVTQESLDKFESKSSIPNLLHSKEEPSIHDERLDSISLIDELVISKGQSYIQEFEESLEEEESIPKETEMEEENDFVTRIEEDSVRSASGQNLKEQLSPSFTDKNYGAVNILEDSICDIVHNVFKQEESDNAEGEIAGKEEENSQNDIRKLEEFFKVKRSESPSPVSEVSKTLLRKEVEENICGRDIDKMEGEHDEKLSKEVERITDILFKNLLNESLKTFDLKGTAFDANEIHYKREFEDQLTNDSEVHDRRDQLTESTEKEAVINEKQDKTVKNVHNITNPILELLDEPSVLLHSKKTTRDSFLCSEEKNEEAAAVEDLETTGLPRSEIQDKAVDASAVSQEWQKQQKVALGLSTNGDSAENGFDLSCQEWFDEDTRRIAEELRLQQLQIEQEIQELEQAQEQLPYFYIREIPNKPPPPYTPPNQQTWTQTTPCSSPPSMPTIKQDLTEEEPRFTTADELHSLTVEVIGYLYDALTTGVNLEIVEAPLEFYDDPDTVNASDFKKHSRKVFKKLVFDLTRDLVKEAYGWERDKPCAPWDWLAFAHKRRKVFPPKSKEMLQETVVNQVSTLFGFSSKTYKEKLVIRWSRKKRDFVDEILIKESHEEESSWTNYDQDEITVKNEITVGILNSLLDESIQIFTAIRNKKLKKL